MCGGMEAGTSKTRQEKIKSNKREAQVHGYGSSNWQGKKGPWSAIACEVGVSGACAR